MRDVSEIHRQTVELAWAVEPPQTADRPGAWRDIARGFGARLRQLVGHGVYRGLIGHIDKRDPVALLGESGELATVRETTNRTKTRGDGTA